MTRIRTFVVPLSISLLSIPSAWAQALPPPSIDAIAPSASTVGASSLTLIVTGTRFIPASRVIWRHGGVAPVALDTFFVNETRLQAQIPSALLDLPGNIPIAVTQPGEGGAVTSNVVTFVIFPGLTITTLCPLSNAIVGVPYTAGLSPGGGTPPYTWTIAAGALPQGITLLPTGTITGTAGFAGRSNFTLRVTDVQSNTATRECSINVVGAQPGQTIFITSLAPNGVIAGSPMQQTTIRGLGFGPGSTAVWNAGSANAVSLSSTVVDPSQITASIPQNLLLNPGVFPIAVRLGILTAQVFSNAEEFTVAPVLAMVTGCPLREVAINSPFTETLAAGGGFPPYTWAVSQGSLAPGLRLSQAGLLSGTPTEATLAQFTLAITDSRGNTATRACSHRILGPLTAAPSSMTFNFDAGGALPPPQDLSVFTGSPDIPFRVQATTESGGTWLRTTATSDRTPAVIRVSVEPGTLGPGAYRGQIVITSDAASNRSVAVPVTLAAGPTQLARLIAAPAAFRFFAPRGGGRIPPQVLNVTNPGSLAFGFATTVTSISGGDWLSVAPASGFVGANTPARLLVRASAGALPSGTYRATITISSPTLPQPIRIPASLSVSLAPELLLVPQSGLVFHAASGGPPPSPQLGHVLAGGNNGFFWEAAGVTAASPNWVRANPPTNATRPGEASEFGVSADPTGLAPGLYFADARITTQSAENSPRLVSAVLQVQPSNASLAPELSSAGLLFTAAMGSNPPPQTLSVRNPMNAPVQVDFQLNGDGRVWTSAPDASRSVPPGESRRIAIAPNVAGLAAGVHRASITVQSSASSVLHLVELTLVVSPQTCTPTRLVPLLSSHASGFAVITGLAYGIEARIVDDCGLPFTAGAVVASATGGQSPFVLTPLNDGRWAASWTVFALPGPVALFIHAEDLERRLQGSITVPGAVTSSPGIPLLAEEGVLSTASFATGAPLAPGSLFAAFGSRLAEGRSSATGFPLPPLLGGTRASIGGRELPLFFAGDLTSFTQVNGMLPYDLNIHTVHQLAVQRGNQRSAYQDIAVASAQPSIFTVTQTGSGQGVVVDGANQFVIADAANPVPRGGVIVIYCEGLGAVNQNLAAGQAAPSNPLAQALAQVTVTIGGRPAQVLFAGLTPLLAGLYQVNAAIPEDIAPGAAVSVVVSAGGLSSPPVTIAVR